MFVWSSTSVENAAGTLTCTRQSRNDPKNRSFLAMRGPPPLMLASDTKSTELVSGRKPYFSRLSSMFWVCVASPSQVPVARPCHASPPLLVTMFRNTPLVGTVMSCAPVETWMSSNASKS
jgi:hypothetical protein